MNQIVKMSLMGLILLGLMVQAVSVASAAITDIETASKNLGKGIWDIFMAVAKYLIPYIAAAAIVYTYVSGMWRKKKDDGDDDDEKEDPKVSRVMLILYAVIIIALGSVILALLEAILK